MSPDEWRSSFEKLRSLLGDADAYQRVFAMGDQESTVSASLADDLADIYRELRVGLDALRSGASPEDVLFEWRNSFEIHWAPHALGALGAMRRALQRFEDGAP